jgi:molybdopterin synthase catalytic subunit
MIIEIAIEPEYIDTQKSLPRAIVNQAGAVMTFTGVVRGEEAGLPIGGLIYEAYQPMAEQTMRAIIDDIGQRHSCLFVRIIHRIGIVPVGDNAVHIVACAVHRAEALAMISEFMDRLKQDVPIWKTQALDTGGRPIPSSP